MENCNRYPDSTPPCREKKKCLKSEKKKMERKKTRLSLYRQRFGKAELCIKDKRQATT